MRARAPAAVARPGPLFSAARVRASRLRCVECQGSVVDRWLIGDRSGIGQRLINGSPAWVHD
ncbi:hypothetical protein DIS09_18000 [Burkholderia pseudomallei]|uniref:Uncharacterized protein n=2 Tax=Burkholderia pseudomallei TaxID=28450 RepID=A0AAX0UA09_BURPE|nr:hypothetical protein BURPS1106A_A2186 [Burkholderia pseudomallei 1106a]AUL61039.1 hypothetical protein BHT10_36760 [Burkholderia pseudomallei]EDS83124.1 hypothetical protein BURPSS13_X0342 [Burkholderia pseudomallei S13]EES20600.1 hypothetical protein BURPS1106B_2997 [Burkholderia pseudomallei 1106b]PJO64813.1 hypothetical protein CWD88_19090 [Burkholderia pseudomallei]